MFATRITNRASKCLKPLFQPFQTPPGCGPGFISLPIVFHVSTHLISSPKRWLGNPTSLATITGIWNVLITPLAISSVYWSCWQISQESEGITHIPSTLPIPLTLPLFPIPFWPYLDGLPKRYHSLNVSGHHHSSHCSLTTRSPGIFVSMLGSPVSTSSASQWFTKVMLCLSQLHYLRILGNISHISTTHRPSTSTQSPLQLIHNRPSTPTLDFLSTHHRPRYNLLRDPFLNYSSGLALSIFSFDNSVQMRWSKLAILSACWLITAPWFDAGTTGWRNWEVHQIIALFRLDRWS